MVISISYLIDVFGRKVVMELIRLIGKFSNDQESKKYVFDIYFYMVLIRTLI